MMIKNFPKNYTAAALNAQADWIEANTRHTVEAQTFINILGKVKDFINARPGLCAADYEGAGRAYESDRKRVTRDRAAALDELQRAYHLTENAPRAAILDAIEYANACGYIRVDFDNRVEFIPSGYAAMERRAKARAWLKRYANGLTA